MTAKLGSQRLYSIRTELLLSLAVLVVAALSFAVAVVLLVYDTGDPVRGPIYLSLLIAGDVIVLMMFAAFQVQRIIIRPLGEAVAAAEAIAGPRGGAESSGYKQRQTFKLTPI